MYTCIIVEPEIEGNLGFLARVMANFDVEQLILVNPQFRIGEEARNRAVHAQDLLDDALILESLEATVEQVDFAIGTTGIESSSSNILRNAVTPKEASERAGKVEGDIAVVLGRESKGLSNDELRLCDFVVKIPTSDDYPVMNVTHAAAIVFYELFRHRGKEEKQPVSSRKEKQQLEHIFKNMLDTMDYPEEDSERAMQCLTNFIGRSFLEKREAHTLIGLFRKIENRLGGNQ